MKARALKRHKDELIIPEGFYFEEYAPVTGRIVSPALGVELQYCKMCLSSDADVTFVNVAGTLVTAFPLLKGTQSFLVREIRTVSAGRVAIVHDGVESTTNSDMTGSVYP